MYWRSRACELNASVRCLRAC